jgi:hypothetical protein
MGELSEPRSLARLARDVLAAATEVTLLMTGPVRASEPAILLHDEDGTPHLWCERGSVVAVAARLRQPAVLTVVSRQRFGPEPGPLTLALAGRLTHVRSSTITGQLIDIVALAPARVAIDVGRDPHVDTYIVPLAAYVAAAPDPITGYAARAVSHANTCHHRELRQYVSDRFGMPTEVIAGAMLAHLDRHGAIVRWVDAAGAHTTTILFGPPATCPSDMAAKLRARLTAPSSSGRHSA